jgi:hypothetical protein
MENIFNKLSIQTHYFDDTLNDISDIIYFYLEDNDDNTLRWDLKDALKNNANEEYI